MTTVTVGNVEITPLQDAVFMLSPGFFLPEHADEMRAEYVDKLDERGLIKNSITCYLLRSDGKTILIDSGAGMRRRQGIPRGNLDLRLREHGLTPADIDVVVHTHLHVDHVGWNTVDDDAGNSRVYFENARFVIYRPEWDFWMQPDVLEQPGSAHLRECVQPLEGMGRLDLLDGEKAIDTNLTFVPSPGHTPGHCAIGIYSAGERAIIAGDASHHAFQLNHPDWSSHLDTDGVEAGRSREKLFAEAEADGRLWMAGHWEYPGMGHIVRVDSKRIFRAL